MLIYNGKNASGNNGDGCYAANTYAAGQMLFDRENPLVLLDRLDKPFFRPMDAFEKSGQYAAGTVFTEGLVYHQGKWFLYYGCADSFVGVAVCDPATALHEGDPVLSVQVPEGVVSQQTGIGTGKVRCFVNSCSGYAAEGERPANMLMSYIYPGRKWCDTSTEQPWLILEFTGIYEVDRLVFRDVGKREANCGNVPEYWVYGRMKTNEDWTLLAHEDGVEGKDEKDISFPAAEVRYLKLVFRRGIRPSGVADNAIRLYGCDVYGAAERPWRPTTPQQGSDPYRYVIVDLEQTYDIKRLLLWDAKSIDTDATNMNAYQMFISQEQPDLSLITKSGDSNTCWTQVADRKNAGSMNKKTVSLSTPVRGRYVKLVFPRTSAGMNNAEAPALYAFHVYGTLVEDEDGMAIPYYIYRETDASVYDLKGIKQERRPLQPGLYIMSGRKVLVHD